MEGEGLVHKPEDKKVSAQEWRQSHFSLISERHRRLSRCSPEWAE